MNKASGESVAIGGGLTAIAVAAIPVLRQFGVSISQDQSDSLMALLTAVIAFGTLIVRSRVTPADKAITAINTALTTEPTIATVAGSDVQSKEILATSKA